MPSREALYDEVQALRARAERAEATLRRAIERLAGELSEIRTNLRALSDPMAEADRIGQIIRCLRESVKPEQGCTCPTRGERGFGRTDPNCPVHGRPDPVISPKIVGFSRPERCPNPNCEDGQTKHGRCLDPFHQEVNE